MCALLSLMNPVLALNNNNIFFTVEFVHLCPLHPVMVVSFPSVCPRGLRGLKVILTPLQHWWDFRKLLFSSSHNNSGSTVCFIK